MSVYEYIVRAKDLTKVYTMGGQEVRALDGVTLDIKRGEYISIMGPSGSGKSTLFNMIGGLDKPTSGSVFIDEVDMAQLTASELAFLRCRKIGYIFQTFNLIPVMTALENVTLPMIFAGLTSDEAMDKGMELLKTVGLGERYDHKPTELSGGQQQRVAIARAFANDPAIILADEPTGNLDLATGQHIITLLKRMNKSLRGVVDDIVNSINKPETEEQPEPETEEQPEIEAHFIKLLAIMQRPDLAEEIHDIIVTLKNFESTRNKLKARAVAVGVEANEGKLRKVREEEDELYDNLFKKLLHDSSDRHLQIINLLQGVLTDPELVNVGKTIFEDLVYDQRVKSGLLLIAQLRPDLDSLLRPIINGRLQHADGAQQITVDLKQLVEMMQQSEVIKQTQMIVNLLYHITQAKRDEEETEGETGVDIPTLLKQMNQERKVTIISATHDLKMINVSDRVVWIRDGKIDQIQERADIKISIGQMDSDEEQQ